MRQALYLLFVSTFLLPFTAHASVQISEIMYDLPGTDTGREWIEVVNTNTVAIDLTQYIFYEAETNHAITLFRGNTMLASGGRAVLIEDPELFLIDYPTYSGALFDSSWSSFSNEGESLEIRDTDGNVLDHIVYSKAFGALGDGMSLGRSGNNLIPQNPSPGAEGGSAVHVTPSAPPSSSANTPQSSGGSSSSSTTFFGVPKNVTEQPFTVSAGGNRILIEHIEHLFDAKVVGVPSQALSYVQYRWNFGNGEEVLEKSVRYRYLRTGEYVVILTATSGGRTVSDRIIVTVSGPEVAISSVTSEGIEFRNSSSRDIDLSGWHIRFGKQSFSLPRDTWILGGRSLFLESRISKLQTKDADVVELLFPNSIVATTSKVFEVTPLVVSLPELKVESKAKSKKSTSNSKESIEEKKIKAPEPIVERKKSKPIVDPKELGVASVLTAVSENEEESGPLMMPLLGLMALIGISSGAVLLMRQSKVGEVDITSSQGRALQGESVVTKSKTNEADSYTIIE